jgi:hypothetical protein
MSECGASLSQCRRSPVRVYKRACFQRRFVWCWGVFAQVAALAPWFAMYLDLVASGAALHTENLYVPADVLYC